MKKSSVRASSVHSSSGPSGGRRRVDRAIRRQVEILEGRRLLSTVLNSGVLTLTGGGGADSFVVTKSGTNVSVVENNGAAKLFALSSVTRIDASLGGGNDTINIGNSLIIPASVNGGDGDDGIITGGGSDTIDGGIGNDYIEGRDGQDLVSYASRNEALLAEIHVNLTERAGAAPLVTTDGSGGVAGELDTYYAVESIAGGSGQDTLTLGADTWDTLFGAQPVVPDLGIYGNGDDDALFVGGVAYSTGESRRIGRQFADGSTGDDEFIINDGSWHDQVTLVGGSGEDYFVGNPDYNLPTVQGGADFDTFQIYGKVQVQYTIPIDLEELNITVLSGFITGNDLANEINVGSFESFPSIDARGGADTIDVGKDGGSNPATILGGDGDDSIRGSAGGLFIDSGEGDDEIRLDSAVNFGGLRQTVVSGSGDDTLEVIDGFFTRGAPSIVHLVQAESLSSLTIGDGGQVIVEQGPSPESNVLRVGTLFVRNAEQDPQGILDLNDNPMIVGRSIFGGGAEVTLQDVTDLIRRNKFGGQFGNRGLLSSLDDTGMTLGVALASELFGNVPASFAGQSVRPTDVLVRLTRAGDVNLDRQVNFDDLVTLSQNYGQSGRSYAQGNLDFSEGGEVGFSDLVILAQNYGSSSATIASPLFAPVSPAKTFVPVAKPKSPTAGGRGKMA